MKDLRAEQFRETMDSIGLAMDVIAVRSGHVARIARPGRWTVWMVDGERKPRVRLQAR